jgi:hypothetical protein
LYQKVSPGVAVPGLKGAFLGSAREGTAPSAGAKMKDSAARPRRIVIGKRDIGVALCAAVMVGMFEKNVTR